jgi:hypothetical protein
MKIIGKLLSIALIAVAFSACSPKENFAPIGENIAVEQKTVSGTWRLTKAMQFDAIAVSRGFPNERYVQSLDLSTVLTGLNEYQISIQENGTYSVTNPKNAPVFFGTGSGSWKFDETGGIKRILFKPTGGADIVANMGVVYRASEKLLNLYFTRYNAEGKPYLQYSYEFSK